MAMNISKILEIAVFIYGIVALVIKTFPTIPAKYPWLIAIMKFLGNISNRQVNDDVIRKEKGG